MLLYKFTLQVLMPDVPHTGDDSYQRQYYMKYGRVRPMEYYQVVSGPIEAEAVLGNLIGQNTPRFLSREIAVPGASYELVAAPRGILTGQSFGRPQIGTLLGVVCKDSAQV